MGYQKGNLSQEHIVRSASAVILSKGYAAVTMGDLLKAAGTSAGKLTHHFPTKNALLEAVFAEMMEHFRAHALGTLRDRSLPAKRRVDGFFTAMLVLYRAQHEPLGCPIGHAAGDSDGVSPAMRHEAFRALKDTERCFALAFEELGHSSAEARQKALIYVSTWQGAVVIARAGGGIAHLEKIFRSLRATE